MTTDPVIAVWIQWETYKFIHMYYKRNERTVGSCWQWTLKVFFFKWHNYCLWCHRMVCQSTKESEMKGAPQRCDMFASRDIRISRYGGYQLPAALTMLFFRPWLPVRQLFQLRQSIADFFGYTLLLS